MKLPSIPIDVNFNSLYQHFIVNIQFDLEKSVVF